MLIHTGTQVQLVAESTTGSGTTTREGSVQSSAILVSLFVNSIASGTLSVTVRTLTDTGKEVDIITFPVVSGPTANLLLRKSGDTLQRFKVIATYTDSCEYEIYVKAVDGGGVQDVTILGQPIDVNVTGGDIDVTIVPPSAWTTHQETVTAVAALLIPASISDRKGILVKNWSTTTDVYIAESLIAADPATAYPLSARDAVALDLTAGSSVYAVTISGTADVRIVQAGS